MGGQGGGTRERRAMEREGGGRGEGEGEVGEVNDITGSKPSNFAGNVFPAIIFFCATVELLYYVGVVQVIVRRFATFFLYLMGTSGNSSLLF